MSIFASFITDCYIRKESQVPILYFNRCIWTSYYRKIWLINMISYFYWHASWNLCHRNQRFHKIWNKNSISLIFWIKIANLRKTVFSSNIFNSPLLLKWIWDRSKGNLVYFVFLYAALPIEYYWLNPPIHLFCYALCTASSVSLKCEGSRWLQFDYFEDTSSQDS